MAKGRWRSLVQWVKIALYTRFTWHSFVPFSNLSRASSVSRVVCLLSLHSNSLYITLSALDAVEPRGSRNSTL